MSRLIVSQHPLVRALVTQLRDATTPPAAFRGLVERLTALLLHDALADVATVGVRVATPLAQVDGTALAAPIVLVPILRAGLGMADGALGLLPDAEVRHLGLYRDEATLRPVVYYDRASGRSLAGATVIVLDPMLATAGSAIAAIDLLMERSKATDVRFVGLIGAPEGVAALQAAHPTVPIHLAALDARLTGGDDPWPAGYIVPGLGDAGDRQFATSAD
ncbi:MAG: uracil phosphoribosyltransferase [Ardenticatenales bacterium]|nr:uracil phosphoribosyltransferase [Ardenticatenales bacterium]